MSRRFKDCYGASMPVSIGPTAFFRRTSTSRFRTFQTRPLHDPAVSDIEQHEQQVIVGTLLRRINKARVMTVREEATPGENYLNYPVFTLLEEAHRFAPAGASVVSTNVLKQILSEGRKIGVGIGLITPTTRQARPGRPVTVHDADHHANCKPDRSANRRPIRQRRRPRHARRTARS